MILMNANSATDATNNKRMVTNTNFVLNRSDANTRPISLRSYQYAAISHVAAHAAAAAREHFVDERDLSQWNASGLNLSFGYGCLWRLTELDECLLVIVSVTRDSSCLFQCFVV